MLFHLGALWRLNDFGLLRQLARISSVSGGSITAGVLALKWEDLEFDDADVSSRFPELVVTPLRRLADQTLDWRAVLSGLLMPGETINDRLAAAYRRHLFGTATLRDLPDDTDGPRFVINATNLQSGALWRFSKPYMADYRVGVIDHPELPLATAVAASSAFPPILSPARLSLPADAYRPPSGDQDLHKEPYTTNPVLADGGVYDNLGLETAWKRYQTILVSDGGGKMAARPQKWRTWPMQAMRVLKVIDNQVRDLRTRQLVNSYQAGQRRGAYWGIRSELPDFPASGALPCPPPATEELAKTPTRLARLKAERQEWLINWGYAVCDGAVRSYYDKGLPAPKDFPYPGAGVS